MRHPPAGVVVQKWVLDRKRDLPAARRSREGLSIRRRTRGGFFLPSAPPPHGMNEAERAQIERALKDDRGKVRLPLP